MINLFESYSTDTRDLHHSLKCAGYDFKTVVLNESGFLSDDIINPYGYFLKFSKSAAKNGCYFNEVIIPDFLEIRATNSFGEIFENDIKRGKIHYTEPKYKRIVDRVDWLDRTGQLLFVEHYNQYGKIFAKTYYNGKSSPIFRTYYNERNEEIIVVHYEVGTVLLNTDSTIEVFQSINDFYIYFFKVAQIPTQGFIINRLSTPFLLTSKLSDNGEDVLVWQEPIYDTVPGNMRLILEDKERTKKIFVQSREAYDKLQKLVTDEKQRQKIQLLGNIYKFDSDVSRNTDILILTNSDNVEKLTELVEGLPTMTFHIGAITEMSSKLLAMGAYANVKLYPNIRTNKVEELLKVCSIYLDINHGNEILNAIRTAFEHNQVILSFEETIHNTKFTANEHIFKKENYEEMSNFIQDIVRNTSVQNDAIERQKIHAVHETVESYQTILHDLINPNL